MSKKQDILIRGIRIITVLAPHVVTGMTVSEIAGKTGYSLPVVCRDLASLKEVGWVCKEDSRWMLTNRPVALARACELAFANLAQKHGSFQHNVNAGAMRILEG